MASLTVREKEHWKERIARKIDKKIEALKAVDPNFMERIEEAARKRALESLGLADLQREADQIEHETTKMQKREEDVQRHMLATIRHVPPETVTDSYYCQPYPEVERAIQLRKAVHEEELLAEEQRGQEILRLRQERDNLLDTVWLASSPVELKTLWQKVVELLGEEQTPLQKEAMAIPVPVVA